MDNEELIDMFDEFKKEFSDDEISYEEFQIIASEIERETEGKEEVRDSLFSLLGLEIGGESELYYTLEKMGEDVVSLIKEVNENNYNHKEEIEFLEKRIKEKQKEENIKLVKRNILPDSRL